MESHKVIKYPMMTERSVNMIENENKLVFIVDRRANKHDIAAAIKELYEVEAETVNTLITRKGEKKAFIKLKDGYDASDVAIRLGIL
ncbi:50S ribosomal protein L23 [Candidatus Bathyarchaeota archaeon RBG_16_57_9]|jgi:large subunit ribosomal protein L23|nr:MAG: 50S ribosomal protein L23 [Candidatus Bathyarchaeota archaeon RBG_16_57_9]OGD52594.1 MAG: 50S ribosomal protein L23 [Candidatus Bathyarchaeota archaeon RBG_13_60_20]